jgi:hypothetical protein
MRIGILAGKDVREFMEILQDYGLVLGFLLVDGDVSFDFRDVGGDGHGK